MGAITGTRGVFRVRCEVGTLIGVYLHTCIYKKYIYIYMLIHRCVYVCMCVCMWIAMEIHFPSSLSSTCKSLKAFLRICPLRTHRGPLVRFVRPSIQGLGFSFSTLLGPKVSVEELISTQRRYYIK